jgi:hypothetical protein
MKARGYARQERNYRKHVAPVIQEDALLEALLQRIHDLAICHKQIREPVCGGRITPGKHGDKVVAVANASYYTFVFKTLGCELKGRAAGRVFRPSGLT